MGTRFGTGHATGESSAAARAAAEQALRQIDAGEVKLSIVFASTAHDLPAVLRSVREVTRGAPLVGCSSAGEFSAGNVGTAGVVVALLGGDVRVKVGVGRNVAGDLRGAVGQAVAGFSGCSEETLLEGWLGRTLFVMTDGLAGGAEELIDELMIQTAMQYQLFGAAAGDDVQFKRTYAFCNDEVLSGGFVCAEVLSRKPFRIAMHHGWRPASQAMRVTSAEGALVKEINGLPAWEVYRRFAEQRGLKVTEENAGPFLMSHLLGIRLAEGHKLRVPLFKSADGSLRCAAEVPQGCMVQIMEKDDSAVTESGVQALRRAREAASDGEVAGALVCECVATRLLLGERFADEVRLMEDYLRPHPVLGLNSYGQLARIQGDFSGMMDATALVCLIPA
jgi:hypothetical protein